MADAIFNCAFYFKENILILSEILLQLVAVDPVDNKILLEQVWHRTGNKPLPKPFVTQFPEAYMNCQTSMS